MDAHIENQDNVLVADKRIPEIRITMEDIIEAERKTGPIEDYIFGNVKKRKKPPRPLFTPEDFNRAWNEARRLLQITPFEFANE